MATYVGLRMESGPCIVYRIEEPWCKPLRPRCDVRSHSPGGFEWGYSGSGPAQLALALLCDVMGDPEAALTLYQRFKFQVIAGLPLHGWIIHHHLIEEWLIGQIGGSAAPAHDDERIELGGAHGCS